jgi:glycerophosphoryl diester phosphodiesterase
MVDPRSLHRALALAATAALAACAGHRPRPTTALFPEPVTVLGHRGARCLAPENTT